MRAGVIFHLSGSRDLFFYFSSESRAEQRAEGS